MSVISMLNKPYLNAPRFCEGAERAEPASVEITDADDRPLLVVPRALALQQRLPRRVVQICVKDARGRIFLQKRSKARRRQAGLWDLSVTDEVLAGESTAGAALRALEEILGIVNTRLHLLSSLRYIDSFGSHLRATCYTAGPLRSSPRPDPEKVADVMFVDQDELRGLAGKQPFLLTFELRRAVSDGWIFL